MKSIDRWPPSTKKKTHPSHSLRNKKTNEGRTRSPPPHAQPSPRAERALPRSLLRLPGRAPPPPPPRAPAMAASRKLQAEIERTLKRVAEGIEAFDATYEKVGRERGGRGGRGGLGGGQNTRKRRLTATARRRIAAPPARARARSCPVRVTARGSRARGRWRAVQAGRPPCALAPFRSTPSLLSPPAFLLLPPHPPPVPRPPKIWGDTLHIGHHWEPAAGDGGRPY